MADYTPNATLSYRADINPELSIFRVRPDAPLPDFLPGQYAELAIPTRLTEEQRCERRSYSIASPSLPNHDLEFYIVKLPGGYFTPALWELDLGARLWCGPKIKGKFTLEEVPKQSKLIMVATGTGLAPFVSMLRQHAENPPWKSVLLIHGARLRQDLGYEDEFHALEKRYPWFHYLPTLTREPEASEWRGARGRVQTLFQSSQVEAVTGSLENPEVHVMLCGNPDMINDLERLLGERGLRLHKKKNPGNIHVERYW